jgi:choline dehydrogenase-like flavoprotein
MTFQAQPTTEGVYRVKVYETDNGSYWKYMPDSTLWIKMTNVDKLSSQFKWNIAPVQGQTDFFTIQPAYDTNVGMVSSTDNTNKYWGYGLPVGQPGSSAKWKIKKDSTSNAFSKIYCESGSDAVDCQDSVDYAVHFYKSGDNYLNQRWVFQLIDDVPPPKPSFKSFESLFFTLTPEQAAKETYDIIIIGTGIGGGVIAGDLFDTNSRLGSEAKSVLVIEKGNLAFHSHCLNASRPSGFGEDRGQQNDTFFSLFRDEYTLSAPNGDWKGGPMHNVGGRSAAWGLFAPRIHDKTLITQFAPGSQLYDDLVRTWYLEAEALMNLSLPATATVHQDLMERLNMKSQRGCQWQWGRIASEFRDDDNFDFAKGAYSPIDKILEIAMSKQRKADGTMIEHPNWKILLRTEVRSIEFDGTTATGVVVRDANGNETTIALKSATSKIVLAAGSVGSPAILMRSGKSDFLGDNGGLHLTDHDIFAKACVFQYINPGDRERIGSMKLQTYVQLKSDDSIILANMAIDASSFLPREFLPNEFFRNENFPKLIVAFIRPTVLNKANTISLDSNQEPVVTINRAVPFSNSDPDVAELRDLTKEVIQVVTDTLSINLESDDDSDDSDDDSDDDDYFKVLELGGVAHELGTIPMQGGNSSDGYCLESDLELRGHNGVYVCDLSVFPYSPEANPTLTLAALALRLSRNVLLPRLPDTAQAADTVYVMNQTGENIQVFVSNRAATSTDVLEVLTPGELKSCPRKMDLPEAVFVYRLDYNSDDKYLSEPQLFVGHPGKILVID